MQATLILALLFALLIAIFAIQNGAPVALSFLLWDAEISLAVVILGSVSIGALTMWLFSYVRQFKLKRRIKKLNKQIDELDENNQKFKTDIDTKNKSQKEETDEQQGILD